MKKVLAFITVLAVCSGSFVAANAANSKIITMQIGKNTATVDGTEKELDSPPVLIDNRTLVPIRFISENFGFNVDWSEENKMITITDNNTKNIAVKDPNAAHLGEDFYIFDLSENVERTSVTYKNRYGIELSADLYVPKNLNTSGKYPAIVVGPPYGGVKEQGPGVYANQLAQLGFVVLAFDPSYNGESGGEPRHTSSPEIFTEDFSAGVDYLGTLKFVDREKIGAVGICGSGGFALSAAQTDTRIKAVVTASLVDISGNSAAMSTEERQTALDNLAAKRWEDVDSSEPEYIPSFPAEPVQEIPASLDPMSAEFYSFYGLERGHHPRARGNFTTTSEMAFMNYSLLDHLDTISPRPVMIIVGENAMSKGISEEIYKQLGEAKEFVSVPNANHIDLYDDVSKIPFEKIKDFFNENLK